ncbi:hypothetical protein D3C72_1671620 [compost metagenome]
MADPARRVHGGHAAHQVRLGPHIGAGSADRIHQLIFAQPVQRLADHGPRHFEQRGQFQFRRQLVAGRDLAGGDRIEQAFVDTFGKALGAHIAQAGRHFGQHVQFRTGAAGGRQQRFKLRVTHIAHRLLLVDGDGLVIPHDKPAGRQAPELLGITRSSRKIS